MAFRSFILEDNMILGKYPFKSKGMVMTAQEALSAALWELYKGLYSKYYHRGHNAFMWEMFGNPGERHVRYDEFRKFYQELTRYNEMTFNDFYIVFFGGDNKWVFQLVTIDRRVLKIDWERQWGPFFAEFEK